jgi:hypothetical protein
LIKGGNALKFKKGDLVVINDFGMMHLFGKINLKGVKAMLYRVNSQVDTQSVYIDKMNGIEMKRAFSNDFFRLATQKEIKMYTIKKIFT